MDRNNFVSHTLRLTGCAQCAAKLADLLGCDVDCEGFIGDLISGYGDLILETAVDSSDEKYEDIVEPFWDNIVNANASLPEIRAFYDEYIAKT